MDLGSMTDQALADLAASIRDESERRARTSEARSAVDKALAAYASVLGVPVVEAWRRVAPEGAQVEAPKAAAFKQPTSAADAYKAGALVTFEGAVYRSALDSNVWSPAAYPQGWERVG